MSAVEGQQWHQVDGAQHEVELGEEEPERHPQTVVDGVAADDAGADDADRCLRVIAPRRRWRAPAPTLLGILASDLPISSEITGEDEGGRDGRHRVVAGRRELRCDDPDGADIDGPTARPAGRGDPALGGGDVDRRVTTVVAPSTVRSTTNGVGPLAFCTAATISSNVETSVAPTFTTRPRPGFRRPRRDLSPMQLPSSPLTTSGLTQVVSPTTAVVGGCRLGRPTPRRCRRPAPGR